MLPAQEIRWGMIYPLIIALVAVIAAHFGRRGRRDVHPWGPALAIAAGFVVAFIGVTGRWTPPTRDVYAWLVIAAGAGVIVSIIASIGDRTRWLVATLSVAVLIATAVLLAWRRKAALVPREFWLTVTLFAGGLVLWWAALEPLATR